MNNGVAVQETKAIARPLRVLVPLIKDELAAGDAAGMENYRRAGEMLLEAKAQVAHGEWKAWVGRNFTLSYETARNYMRLAGSAEKGSRLPFSTLTEMVTPGRTTHCPPYTAPVREILTNRVDLKRLAEDRQSREKEQKILRDLALQLVDIGYKVLATKLHPDKGGSSEAMARLNRVRTWLTSSAKGVC